MNCCAECFGDRGLRKSIFPLRSTKTGRCSYCSSENVAILAPAQLSDYFELLTSAYRRDAGGKLLVHWFREDWGMFEDPPMDDFHARDLLAEILNDGEIVRQTFSPVFSVKATPVSEWEKLRVELMHRNRFFPKTDIDLDRLKMLFSHLTLGADEVPSLWYRARIQSDDRPFDAAEMGAPPETVATHGRANPAGIPYLYLGSTYRTAISEIRPHTSERVCVADFITPEELKLVDLRNPRRMVSPFLLEDSEAICRMRSDLPFLERLGDELTRPVLPRAAAVDYTPSQYLCEFIKTCGYDGVIYQSSVGDGMNLALFNPSLAQPGAVARYRVDRVLVEVVPIGT